MHVDGTSNWLHQLSVHFRKLSSSSRGSDDQPGFDQIIIKGI